MSHDPDALDTTLYQRTSNDITTALEHHLSRRDRDRHEPLVELRVHDYGSHSYGYLAVRDESRDARVSLDLTVDDLDALISALREARAVLNATTVRGKVDDQVQRRRDQRAVA